MNLQPPDQHASTLIIVLVGVVSLICQYPVLQIARNPTQVYDTTCETAAGDHL